MRQETCVRSVSYNYENHQETPTLKFGAQVALKNFMCPRKMLWCHRDLCHQSLLFSSMATTQNKV